MKQFKSKVYLLFSLFLTLISCAEEGPHRLGNMDYDIKVSMISPTTAIVHLTIPRNTYNLIDNSDDRLVSVGVVDTQSGNGKGILWDNKITFELINRTDNQTDYFLSNLTPNTTYHVVLRGYIDYNKNKDLTSQQIYTDCSFTTAKEGDFSGLGEAKYQRLSTTSDITGVRFKLPEGMSFPSGQYGNPSQDLNAVRAYASTSPDMSNAVESIIKAYGSPSDVFYFRGLKDTKYYFQLKGNFYSSFTSEYSHDYVWKDVTLDAVDQIDSNVSDIDENNPIAKLDITFLGYDVVRDGKPYTLVSFTLNDASFENKNSKLSLRLGEHTDMSDAIRPVYNSDVYNDGTVSQSDFYFLNLEKRKYYVELTGVSIKVGEQIIENVVIKDSIDLVHNPLSPISEFMGYTKIVTTEDGSEKTKEYAVIKSTLPKDCSLVYSQNIGRMFSVKGDAKNYSFGEYYMDKQLFSLFPKDELVQDSFFYSNRYLKYKSMYLQDVEVPIMNSIIFTDTDKEIVLFGDISCELIAYDDFDIEGNECTVIQVIMPEYSWFISQYSVSLYASDNPDMKNKIQSFSCSIGGHMGVNKFLFPVLEKKTYYFEFRGALIYHLGGFYNVVIRIHNSIDLSKE